MITIDCICIGYKVIQPNLNSKLFKENEKLFEAKKIIWWANEFSQGYYLHHFNKPNKNGLTAIFKRIETPRKAEEEYKKIQEYCQEFIKKNKEKSQESTKKLSNTK